MSDYKQSFREWEIEYERRVAFLREKYNVLLTTPKPARRP